LLVILSGSFEPLLDQVQVRFGKGDAMLGLFLKGVQYVYHPREANGVDGAICVAVEVVRIL
jgi:hypothetical protein